MSSLYRELKKQGTLQTPKQVAVSKSLKSPITSTRTKKQTLRDIKNIICTNRRIHGYKSILNSLVLKAQIIKGTMKNACLAANLLTVLIEHLFIFRIFLNLTNIEGYYLLLRSKNILKTKSLLIFVE